MTGLRAVLDEHAGYLFDHHRMAAYRAALAARLTPGSIVVDLGAGTGALGLLALDAGAAHVHAVEATAFIEAARAIARANGAGSRISHHRGSSLDVRLPEPADLVVADQLGPFLHAGDLVRAFADAVERHLRPGGATMPQAVEPVLALVERPDVGEGLSRWGAAPGGLDVSALREKAANTPVSGRLRPEDLLAPPVALAAIVDWVEAAKGWVGTVDVPVDRRGEAHAIAAWWTAELAPGVTITNGPGDPKAIDRDQALFPLDPPLPVRPGESLRLRLDLRFGAGIVSWSAEGPGGHRRGSTWASMALDADDVHRVDPEAQPVLHDKGRARAWVLGACDGTTSVDDLVVGVLAAHPTAFGGDRSAAEELVTAVVLANSA